MISIVVRDPDIADLAELERGVAKPAGQVQPTVGRLILHVESNRLIMVGLKIVDRQLGRIDRVIHRVGEIDRAAGRIAYKKAHIAGEAVQS